ncbi:MAG: hypothetical protein LBI41_01745 [Lactobacillales bacterium]|jgi:hypothetical protein|nr:hypothetical protein [Lactobacillales bacterium]
MKNKILELLRYQGISFCVSTVCLFLLLIFTAVYSFIKGKSIYFPRKVLSFIAESNGSSSSIEIKFMPHFISMFIIFSILFGIVLFFICKFYKKSKN